MHLSTRDMEFFAKIRELGPQEAQTVFMVWKFEIEDAAMKVARKQDLENLFKTIEYADCLCSSDQWLIDCRKKRAEDAILRGIIE